MPLTFLHGSAPHIHALHALGLGYCRSAGGLESQFHRRCCKETKRSRVSSLHFCTRKRSIVSSRDTQANRQLALHGVWGCLKWRGSREMPGSGKVEQPFLPAPLVCSLVHQWLIACLAVRTHFTGDRFLSPHLCHFAYGRCQNSSIWPHLPLRKLP